MARRPREEEIIRYDENDDLLSVPLYPDPETGEFIPLTGGTSQIYSSEYTGGSVSPAPTTTPTGDTTTPTTTVTTPSGTTPVTTPTTTAPMNYEDFLKQQWESAYNSAETERARAEKAAETARQKQIIDAQNAYKTGLSTYGANAEAAASMGLTGSGYGEYLTGKSYATQRGEVASANRTAAALKEQALYNEGQAKKAADEKYAAGLLGIEENRNNSYNSLYNSATGGASIESIMNDSRWNTLTDEQRTTITQVTTFNSLATRIANGESLESIKGTAEWAGLTVDQQTQLEGAYNSKTESETTANNDRISTTYTDFLGAINSGKATLDQIKLLPGYEELTPDMKTQLEAAQGKITATESTATLEDSISVGNFASLEELMADPRWEKLTEPEKQYYTDYFKQYLKNEQTRKDEEYSYAYDNLSINEIDRRVENGTLDPEIADSVKKDRADTAYKNFVSALNRGDVKDIASILNELDQSLNSGFIGSDTYDSIKKLLNDTPQGLIYQVAEGKIDSTAFVKKMMGLGYKTYNIPGSEDTASSVWNGGEFTISVPGQEGAKEYSLEFDTSQDAVVHTDLAKKLDAVAGAGAPKYRFVIYDGKMYMRDIGGWWQKVKDGDDSVNDFIADFLLTQEYGNVTVGKDEKNDITPADTIVGPTKPGPHFKK